MGEMLRGLPPYVWLVALPQLTSRICHPHCETQRFTQHILTRVTQAFPHQARAAAPGPRALLPGSRVALQASCQVSGRLAGRPQALPLGRGQHGRAPCQVRWAASRSAARNLAALGRGSAVRSSGKGSTVATGIRHQGENSPMSHVRDSCSDKMQQQPCLHVLQLSVHPQHVRQHAVSAHAPQPAGRRGRARPQWPAEPRGRRARARRRCGRWRRCARAPCLSARTRRRRSWRPRASTTPSAATRAASACSSSLPRFPTSSSGCATTTRASDRRRRARPSPILTCNLTLRSPACSHQDPLAAAQAQVAPAPGSGSLSGAGTYSAALPGTPPACAVRPPARASDQLPVACRPAAKRSKIAAPTQATDTAARRLVACLPSCHLGSGVARAHASHASQVAWHLSRAPRVGAQQELLHAARIQRAGAHDAGGRDGADHGRPHPGAARQRSALSTFFFPIFLPTQKSESRLGIINVHVWTSELVLPVTFLLLGGLDSRASCVARSCMRAVCAQACPTPATSRSRTP